MKIEERVEKIEEIVKSQTELISSVRECVESVSKQQDLMLEALRGVIGAMRNLSDGLKKL